MKTNKLSTLLIFFLFLLSAKNSRGQTFECFIDNDTFISTTQFEFDVFLKSTSTDFLLRTVQMAYTINQAFTPPGAAPTISYVAGSTQLNSYTPGLIQQNSTPSLSAFQIGVNIGGTCATGTLISTTPIRVGKFRIVSNSGAFNCEGHDLSMIRPVDPSAGSNVLLKMAVTRWSTIDCSVPTSVTITSNGAYSRADSGTVYSQVGNLNPILTTQPVSASTTCPAVQATFSVTATSYPGITTSLTYQWMQNGIPINNGSAQGGTFSGATTPVLSITNATSLLNGNQYTCVVSQCNSITSSVAVLTVFGIDDNNACTVDGCDPGTGNVTHTPVNTNDNNACTVDGCDPVTGVFHNAPNIDDSNACTDDACNPVTGAITHTPVNTNDNNLCTTDGCNPVTGVFHNPVNTNDNNACTIDGCDSLTGVFHNPVNIDDNNACTIDACNSTTGFISHTNINPNDGNPCTTDGCNPVTGVFNTPVNVDDNNACTIDACNPSTGAITHQNVNVNDGDSCTVDGCNPVTGVFHNSVNINDNNACTADACNPANGVITHIPLSTDDNNACTTDGCDTITGPFHTPVVIDDNNPCTIDACNPVTGVITHDPKLNIHVSSTPASCNANDGTASAIIISGTSPYSYQWSPGGQTTQAITGLQAGFYFLTVTDGSNCIDTSSVTVASTSSSPQAPTAIKGPGGACRGQTGVVYTITPVPGASSYNWVLPSGTSGNSNTSSITVNFDAIFNGGSICVTASNSCGTSSSTCINVPVINRGPAQAGLMNGSPELCPTDTGQYSIAPVSYATNYLWTASNGLSIIDGQGTNTVVVTALPGFAKGTLNVRPSNCKAASGLRIFNISGLPEMPVIRTAPSTSVCAGTCHDFNIEDKRDATSWTFSAPTGCIISGTGVTTPGNPVMSTNPIVNICFPLGFITGDVAVKANNLCGESASLIYHIGSVPGMPSAITGPVENLCNTSQNIYSIAPVPDASWYYWTVPSGATIGSNNFTSITVDYNIIASGPICVSAFNSCGLGPKKCLGVKGAPAAPSAINGPVSVCKSQNNVIYTLPPVSGASAYTWTVSGGAAIVSGAGTDYVQINFNSASTTTAVLTVTANNSCGSSLPFTVLIHVNLNCRLANQQQPFEDIHFNLFPNPTQDASTISFDSETSFNGAIRISDLLGKETYIESFRAAKGANKIELNIQFLPAGLYFVLIYKETDLAETIKLVIE